MINLKSLLVEIPERLVAYHRSPKAFKPGDVLSAQKLGGETEKELLTSYSKFDNRLYKSMKALTEAWYENPTISRDEALAIVRKVVQL